MVEENHTIAREVYLAAYRSYAAARDHVATLGETGFEDLLEDFVEAEARSSDTLEHLAQEVQTRLQTFSMLVNTLPVATKEELFSNGQYRFDAREMHLVYYNEIDMLLASADELSHAYEQQEDRLAGFEDVEETDEPFATPKELVETTPNEIKDLFAVLGVSERELLEVAQSALSEEATQGAASQRALYDGLVTLQAQAAQDFFAEKYKFTF